MAEYKTLTQIEKNFCDSFYAWSEQRKIEGIKYKNQAFDLGLDKSQFANIRAGRKPLDEDQRREIARKIGMDYDEMIGLQPFPKREHIPASEPTPAPKQPQKPQRPAAPAGLKIVEKRDPVEAQKAEEAYEARQKVFSGILARVFRIGPQCDIDVLKSLRQYLDYIVSEYLTEEDKQWIEGDKDKGKIEDQETHQA